MKAQKKLEELGSQLRKERKRQGYNIAQVAEEAGISGNDAHLIEVGMKVDTHTLAKYIHALGYELQVNPNIPDMEDIDEGGYYSQR